MELSRVNNRSTVGTLATGAVTANSTGALNLGSGMVTGNLVANSYGFAITETGALTVTGLTNVTSGAGAITLMQANDFQGAITASGTNIQINDVNALTAALTDAGSSAVTAGGNLVVSGTTTGKVNNPTTRRRASRRGGATRRTDLTSTSERS